MGKQSTTPFQKSHTVLFQIGEAQIKQNHICNARGPWLRKGDELESRPYTGLASHDLRLLVSPPAGWFLRKGVDPHLTLKLLPPSISTNCRDVEGGGPEAWIRIKRGEFLGQ